MRKLLWWAFFYYNQEHHTKYAADDFNLIASKWSRWVYLNGKNRKVFINRLSAGKYEVFFQLPRQFSFILTANKNKTEVSILNNEF